MSFGEAIGKKGAKIRLTIETNIMQPRRCLFTRLEARSECSKTCHSFLSSDFRGLIVFILEALSTLLET